MNQLISILIIPGQTSSTFKVPKLSKKLINVERKLLKDKERQNLRESEERLKDVNQQLNDISQILSLAEGKFQNKIVVMNAFAIPFLIFISWIGMTVYRKRRLKA